MTLLDGLGMHPLHPNHPYNNGHSALGDTREETPWYKNPLWILAGAGVLVYLTTRG